MSTGGKIASFKFNSEEELIKKVEARRFNELEVKYALSSFDIGIAGGAGVVVTGVFKPSPSNDFWFLSEEWPMGGDHSVRNRKMNARAAELALEHYKVKQKPCLFEVVFEVTAKESEHDILDEVAECLVNRMPEALRQTEPFGCCDAGDSGFCVRLESNFLTTRDVQIMAKLMPPAYTQLGLQFDKLHPLMFGKRQLCKDITQAIGSNAKLVLRKGKESLAVIRLTADCDLLEAKKRASKWLLIQ